MTHPNSVSVLNIDTHTIVLYCTTSDGSSASESVHILNLVRCAWVCWRVAKRIANPTTISTYFDICLALVIKKSHKTLYDVCLLSFKNVCLVVAVADKLDKICVRREPFNSSLNNSVKIVRLIVFNSYIAFVFAWVIGALHQTE